MTNVLFDVQFAEEGATCSNVKWKQSVTTVKGRMCYLTNDYSKTEFDDKSNHLAVSLFTLKNEYNTVLTKCVI